MITEDYVSFEVAKLLKEKGFDVEIYTYFDLTTMTKIPKIGMSLTPKNWNYKWKVFSLPISAPTIQRAMKWLRESYNITVLPGVRIPHTICGKIEAYWAGIWYVPKNNGGALCFTSPTPENGYSSFEEACEAGIKYCLENLI